MKQTQGTPLPLGVTGTEKGMNFAVAVPRGKACELLLYQKEGDVPVFSCQLAEDTAAGEVRCVQVEEIGEGGYEYLYRIDGETYIDPYAKKLSRVKMREKQRDMSAEQEDVPGRISTGAARIGASIPVRRGELVQGRYDWEGDEPLAIPMNQVVAYSLHVRGFTKHASSKAKHKGTFQGVIEKLPYLTELGVNQIHCMPVYEFEEYTRAVTNY